MAEVRWRDTRGRKIELGREKYAILLKAEDEWKLAKTKNEQSKEVGKEEKKRINRKRQKKEKNRIMFN